MVYDFLVRYEYFTTQLIGLVLLILILALFRIRLKLILLGGILAIPQALCSIFLIPSYWTPELVFNIKPGIEDYIFCFLTGAYVSLFFQRFVKQTKNKTIRIIISTLVCYAISAIIIIGMIAIGFKNIYNPLLFMLIWTCIIFVGFKKYRSIIVASSLGFAVIYFALFVLVQVLYPAFTANWQHESLLNISLIGVPIEEVAWSILYGSSWSAALAVILKPTITDKADLSL